MKITGKCTAPARNDGIAERYSRCCDCIQAGTRFGDLPDDWRCPRCKRKKEKFVQIS